MGCASSSPIMNGPAGLAGKARNAVGDIVQQGEETLHDVGETLNGTIGSVKNAVSGVVQGIDHAVHNATEMAEEKVKHVLGSDTENLNSKDCTHIPLKDPVNNELIENMEKMEETLAKAEDSIIDETDKLADDLIKETNDVVNEMENNLRNTKANEEETQNKTPTHSIDSLKTNSPEPEIEKALSNDLSKSPPSPKATLTELSNIETNIPLAQQHNLFGIDQPDAEDSTNNNHSTNTHFSDRSNEADFKFNINDIDEFDIDSTTTTTTAYEMIKTEPTHWEKLADAILSKPIVRFDNNNFVVSSSPRNGGSSILE